MVVWNLSDSLVPFVSVEGLELILINGHLEILRGRWLDQTQIFRKESDSLLPRVKVAGRRAGPT